MSEVSDHLSSALSATCRADMWDTLRVSPPLPGLNEITRLTARLRQMKEPLNPAKIAVVRTYATELLRPYWVFESLLNGFELQLYEAPFGLVHDNVDQKLREMNPDVTYFFLRWEDLDPKFQLPISSLPPPDVTALTTDAVERICGILQSYRRAVSGLMVATLLPPMIGPELGLYDSMATGSDRHIRHSIKRSLAQKLAEKLSSFHFADLDSVCMEAGRSEMFDLRLWHSHSAPYSSIGSQRVVRQLFKYVVLLKKPRIKVIALDADNTLWGGILGEDGLDGIALGPEYPGNAFVAFQRRILDLQSRGILLALCSKNNPEDVRQALRQHRHQLLREETFAALRVNWMPKVENLRSIAKELNLGLDSFLFVEDSPHECYQARQQIPEMLTVQTPQRIVEVPYCLENIAQLETLAITDEDSQRSALYARDRQRQELACSFSDQGEYLRSLQMVMKVSLANTRHLARIAQLTQKTNQFNLTTRRYLEADIARMLNDPKCLVADFSLADVFGDSGIVGVALVRDLHSETAVIDTFLMSCRVIGRGAEGVFLGTVIGQIAQRGAKRVRSVYLHTAKNALVKQFWPEQGFAKIGDGEYEFDLQQQRQVVESSIRVIVERAGQDGAAG